MKQAIILCGLPQTGKSTVAGYLMDDYDLVPSMEHVWEGLKLLTGIPYRDLRKKSVDHWLGGSEAGTHIYDGFNPTGQDIVIDDVTELRQLDRVLEVLRESGYEPKVFAVTREFISWKNRHNNPASGIESQLERSYPVIKNDGDFTDLMQETFRVLEENNVSIQQDL